MTKIKAVFSGGAKREPILLDAEAREHTFADGQRYERGGTEYEDAGGTLTCVFRIAAAVSPASLTAPR
jgi:hypothetical protein